MSPRILSALCTATLEQLVSQTPGIETAAIVTGDGFEVASVVRDDVSVEKLAAMVSSLLALSEAVTAELRMSRCRDVIIDTESGAVVTLRVPSHGHDLLMCVRCKQTVSLGTVLFAARDCVQGLARRLLPK